MSALDKLKCPMAPSPHWGHKFGRRVWLATGDEFPTPPGAYDPDGNELKTKNAVKILGYTPARCCTLCHGVFVEKPEEPK